MKNGVYLYMLLSFTPVLLNAGPVVDFDGKNKEVKNVTNYLKNTANDSVSVATKETDSSPIPEQPNRLKSKLEMKTASGKWITIQPEKDENGKNYYVFLPNGAEMRFAYMCPVAPPQTWSLDISFTNDPRFGGHLHYQDIPPLTHTPEGAPVPPARLGGSNLPTQIWYDYSFFAPYYGTRVSQRAIAKGSCVNTFKDVYDFKVRGLFPMKQSGPGYILAYDSFFPSEHLSIHNVHELFERKLINIGLNWNQMCPKSYLLRYQRMSLPWGGHFDLNSDWMGFPAYGHGWGTSADVSKIDVNKGNRKKLIKMLCHHVDVVSEAYSEKDPSHYHISLRGVPHKNFGYESAEFSGNKNFISCCPSQTGLSDIPQACIDLAPGFNEILPEESTCQ